MDVNETLVREAYMLWSSAIMPTYFKSLALNALNPSYNIFINRLPYEFICDLFSRGSTTTVRSIMYNIEYFLSQRRWNIRSDFI